MFALLPATFTIWWRDFRFFLDKAKEKEVLRNLVKRKKTEKRILGILRKKTSLYSVLLTIGPGHQPLHAKAKRIIIEPCNLSHLQCCFYPHACWGWLVLQARAQVPYSSRLMGHRSWSSSQNTTTWIDPAYFFSFRRVLFNPWEEVPVPAQMRCIQLGISLI